MSDNGKKAGGMRRWIYALMFFVSFACDAETRGLPDGFVDPLSTRPPVLDAEPRLPGDDMPVACSSSTDLTKPLTIGDAVDLALCHNPRVQVAWASIKIQAAALGEASAAWLPTVNGSISQLATYNRYQDARTMNTHGVGRTMNASLNWRLLDFGGRAANRAAAQQLLTAALAGHDASMQKAVVDVIGSYFDVQNAQAARIARTESAELAESTLRASRQRLVRGVASRADVLQAEAAWAKAILAARRADGDVARARAELVFAAGLPAGTRIEVESAIVPVASDAERQLSDWLRTAEEAHPEIRAARAKWKAAEAKVTTTRSEGMPTVDLSGTLSRNGYPNQGLQSVRATQTSIGLTLTIPFFDGFSRTYRIRGAQAQAELAQAQLLDTQQQILRDVLKAHADAETTADSLDASARLLAAAEAALTSARNRYAFGAGDILELLSAQAALADARQERVRTLAEWEAARLRLFASAGVIGRWAFR
ncbi:MULTISPECIES: TolC family protein [Burkholderia]|uniref:Protein CyaE n=1 Tax=Burkholderia ambifaria (strain MC40-6) TaxID=398577 RepID=B1Z0P8_BURA4|nr:MULTISPECIES: TolC family protein [Burkholderia]ACB67600.1 outer membrane efflux protein [Burkholderia ambifaria MC40-6]